MLKLASKTMELVDEIEAHADDLVHDGLRPLDALQRRLRILGQGGVLPYV